MFRFLRGRSGALLIVSLIIFVGFAAYRYLDRTGSTLVEFDQPKFMVVALEGIPLIRENGQPLDVMLGEPVKLACQRVSPKAGQGTAKFVYDFGDGTQDEKPDCDLTHAFQGRPGQIVTLDAQYVVEGSDGGRVVVDRYRSEIRLIAQAPFFRLRGFGTPANEAIASVSLPHEVIPYVDSALKLDPAQVKAKAFVVAFFTRRDGEGVAYLRVAPPKEGGQAIRAITSPLKYYRDFGSHQGLAGVPDEPITIGQPEDDRLLFDVFAGLFTTANVDALLAKCCAGGGAGVMNNTGLRLDEIRALAHEGLLTEPLRVVRVSGASGGAKVLVPASGAAPATAAP
jgi:hypothetical protein